MNPECEARKSTRPPGSDEPAQTSKASSDSGLVLNASKPIQQSVGYLARREHLIDSVQKDRFARHTKDNGCGFILSYIEAIDLLHFQHAACAIHSHAREHRPNYIPTQIARTGGKQEIHRWQMAIHSVASINVDGTLHPSAHNGYMKSAWR
jgi:hypothetical protein